MSSTRRISIEPLTPKAFSPYGTVVAATEEAEHFPINQGRTQRFHALAKVEVLGEGAEAILSIFRGQPVQPLLIELMERHPLGSQAFVPLNGEPFYAVVAPPGDFDENAVRAFYVAGDQGINFAAGTWHAPLLPLNANADYLVVDRRGAGNNCDEVTLTQPIELQPDSL